MALIRSALAIARGGLRQGQTCRATRGATNGLPREKHDASQTPEDDLSSDHSQNRIECPTAGTTVTARTEERRLDGTATSHLRTV